MTIRLTNGKVIAEVGNERQAQAVELSMGYWRIQSDLPEAEDTNVVPAPTETPKRRGRPKKVANG